MGLNSSSLLIALGIALGMFFFSRTGYSPGGIITPGLLAIDLADPSRLGTTFACAFLTSLLLTLAIRAWGLYGRQRTAASMLIAVGIRAALSIFLPSAPHWTGWVAPGLIGADMHRQGILPTSAASLAAAFATSLAANLLYALPGVRL